MSGSDGDEFASGDRLALLLAFGRIGLFTRDMASGVARWDHCLFDMTGLDPARGAPDWPGFLRCVHPEDRAALEAHFAGLQHHPARGEVHFRFCRPDGDVRLLHSLYDVRLGAGGDLRQIVGVMVDDSEAGHRLQQGERSRHFLQHALEMSGVSVWSIDLATRRVHFNAVGLELMGLASNPLGLPVDSVRNTVHPEDLEALIAAADEAVAGDRVVDVVARYRSADGGWRTLLTRRIAVRDEAGRATALLGVSLDLTGRNGERARADALAARTQLVAQAMEVGFWQRDADGQAVVWDAQMYRLYGRHLERLPPTMDEWIDTYVQPQARDGARQRLQTDIAAWTPETLMTVPTRGDDGVERWVRAWTRRYERDGQRIAMGMHVDVTEQVRLETVQREAERSERASREKSAFMALMSHRLRTPLNAVLGFAQLMAQDTVETLTARQRERLARIDAAGTELLAMIDDVFELAALDVEPVPVERAAVPLNAVVTQLREAVEPLARLRGVALHLDPVPGGVQIATERRLLGQALRHLVAHAVRRNERGGHVALMAVLESPWVRLELSDGGPRLDAQQRELLFDTASAPEVEASHGDPLVGLDLVRQVLERLGAQVDWLRPDPADSALLVRLPLAPQAAADAAAWSAQDASGATQAAAARPMSLLCIEDNPVNLMLVQELVAMRPQFRFLSAVDGLSGLALAFDTRPDAVLLDLHLPDLDGRDVAARLRADARTANCRIIALSANALPEDIRSARDQGFDDYWTKPIDFDRFLAGLDAIERRLQAPMGPGAP